jgi:transcription termination/antitermination protein NusG
MQDEEIQGQPEQPEPEDTGATIRPEAEPVQRPEEEVAEAAAGVNPEESLPEEAQLELVETEPAETESFEPAVEEAEPVVEAAVEEAGPVVDVEAAAEAETEADTEADERPAIPVIPDRPNMNWYIIHTYSGFEEKVKESLRGRSQAFGFAERIGDILIPKEEVVEMRGGKKVTSKRMLYPGYVLVQMEMDESLWHAVKDTPRVTGFVGGGSTPVPLSADDINQILYRQASSAERPRPKLSFEKGEMVRITDGPFNSFQGRVDEVNPERDTLRVLVTIFGRSTPVELDFLQVEKVN